MCSQRVENECAEIKKTAQELDLTLKKAEAEKAAKDNQIRSLQEEMKAQVCHSSHNLLFFSSGTLRKRVYSAQQELFSLTKGFSKSALEWSEEDFQDDNIAKLSKERKAQEEANKKLQVRH